MKNKTNSLIFLLIAIALPIALYSKPAFVGYLVLAGIMAISALGLNIILGYSGQISLGHAAFMAIGAYSSAILTMQFHVPFIIALTIGTLIAAFVGILVGFPSLRLSGFYLAIVTMALGEAVVSIFKNWKLAGGNFGIRNIPPPSILGIVFSSEISKYYLVLFFLLLSIYISNNLVKSGTGRAMRGLRDSEIAAQSVGINIAKYKIIAFGLGSALGGISGALYAHTVTYIHPTAFGIGLSIELLSIVILGGVGTIVGPIIGSLFWVILPLLVGNIQTLSSVVFGVALIVVVLLYPRGLVGIFDAILSKFSGGKK
ncbi:MAG: branched-chain amino acid ABC transporter permease [Nitrospiraceae bacterium]|nr:branched-chain amino acid ABC transporter permease [Nitrospiraceae bacterium]